MSRVRDRNSSFKKASESMKTLAWTRQYKNARVFCCQSGHDNQVFADSNFRTVIARGIQWLAGRI